MKRTDREGEVRSKPKKLKWNPVSVLLMIFSYSRFLFPTMLHLVSKARDSYR